MPLAGWIADRYDRRKLLIATQSAMALSALGLGLLVLTGRVTLLQVYLFAGVMGCISAFDSPVRQTFIAELVGDDNLPNAVALNSSLFNSAQLIGPAVAGVMIAATGTGWVFLVNAVSFVAVIAALMIMHVGELHPQARVSSSGSGIADGLRYVRHRPDLVLARLSQLTVAFL
jgi:MFS family permease